MTTLTEIANHAAIQKDYGVLAQAVSLVASPQIRNQGTLAAMYRRTCAAGTTAADGRVTAQAETFVTRIRRWGATRARHLWRQPLRGRAPVRFGSCADRARREVRGADGEGRAGCRCGGLFCRAGG